MAPWRGNAAVSTRLTLTLCLGVLAVLTAVAIAVAAWLVSENLPDAIVGAARDVVLVYGGAAAFVMLAVIALVWAYLDHVIAQPVSALVRDIEVVLHANPGHQVDLQPGHQLGALPAAVNDLVRQLASVRADVNCAIEMATAQVEQQKNELAAIVHDLHEGVLVCTLAHRILLYNRRALQLLRVGREIGLDRSVLSFLTRQPVLHGLSRLSNRIAHHQRDGERQSDLGSVSFVGSTTDGQHLLQGRMSLIIGADGAPTGYVLSFNDSTHELAALGLRDRLMRDATEGLRTPVATIRAASEILASAPDLSSSEQAAFKSALQQESERLGSTLERLSTQYRSIITGHWPMSDIYSANLFQGLADRLRERRDIEATVIGLPQWLHGDSYSLLELLDRLIARLAARISFRQVELEAVAGDKRISLDVVWTGAVPPEADLARWLDEPTEDLLGGLSLRDILERHKTDVWVQLDRQGRARLRLPLAPPQEPVVDQPIALPARPEFYDFDLLRRQPATGSLGASLLRTLNYVVFDTETTGLKPDQGDEIVAIAGVRVVNGRILTGESFERLVNPRRLIPKESMRFHGITDAMVGDKPPIEVVLPQFRSFVGDAVLIAHNAAFDLRFLRAREADASVYFDVPVLDTFLLSVYLHDLQGQHTLDALAQRLGIVVQGRHTALGDSLATAGCFLRMLDMLEARGITTLDDALAVSQSAAEAIARHVGH